MSSPTPCRSHRSPTSLKEFLYGSSYYPEHWDAEVRAGDPALLRAAGWNVVRMAEFGWDVMETEEGRFDFSLYDDMIARFGSVGIRTILCTPTAAPPRWMTVAHPEILREDAKGAPQVHGSRQHASHFSPLFREYSRRITRAMAAHFAGNPHVIGWQTDNEFHCHFSEDHSPASQAAFIEFLRHRFGDDIGALNRGWGTAFWAQTYRNFEEVLTPLPDRPTHLNPAHVLDYYRHLDRGVTLFQRDQVEILHAARPDWWITHNGCFNYIDYAGEFSADLDFLGFDCYPEFDVDPRTRSASQAFNLDAVRSYSGNFLILEQQSGPGGQSNYFNGHPEPGEMRRYAYTTLARGGDGLLFFRERSCRFGAEEYWCGVLDHDNVPRRRYREAAQIGVELARVGPELLGTSVEVSVGVATGDFDAQFGHLPLSLGLPTPRQAGETIHRHLLGQGHAVGCVHPADKLEGLKAYFVPHLALFEPGWIAGWEAWVRAGGALVIGARSGSKDRQNNVIAETLPGALRGLVGATVEEYGRQNRPELRPRSLAFGDVKVPTDLWYEILAPEAGTETAATWEGGFLGGSAAVTRRRLGKGAVYYVGTYFTAPVVEALEQLLIADGFLAAPAGHVPGVERVVRSSGGKRLHFIVNHNDHPVTVSMPKGRDLVGDRTVEGPVILGPAGVVVVRE